MQIQLCFVVTLRCKAGTVSHLALSVQHRVWLAVDAERMEGTTSINLPYCCPQYHIVSGEGEASINIL